MSFKMSENIDKLATALCKFQEKVEPVLKDAPNHFGKYANLEGVIASIKAPLSEAGLSYHQPPITNSLGCGVLTMIMHTSGQFIATEFAFPVISVPNVNKNCQAQGIILSYYRRYALLGALGLSQTDDDGQTAVDIYIPQDMSKQERDIKNLKKLLYEKIQGLGLSEKDACKRMDGVKNYKDLKEIKDYSKIQIFMSLF